MSYTVGIVWKLDYGDFEQSDFRVHWAWCYSDLTGTYAHMRVPASWHFKILLQSGFTSDPFGASETRGLLGGVRSERLEALSEQCERAIGDALTYAVAEMTDGLGVDNPVKIVILGPALPKVVGRLSSLRLHEKITIAWICPSPFPTWIAPRVDEILLVPRRHSSIRAEGLKTMGYQSWEEEPLIAGFRWVKDGRDYVVQYLCSHLYGDPIEGLGLGQLKGIQSEFAAEPKGGGAVWLPREITASAGQVHVDLTDPYQNARELCCRFPREGFGTERLFSGQSRQQENRIDTEKRVFTVEWGSAVRG